MKVLFAPLAALALTAVPAQAQRSQPLFASSEPLHIAISGPISSLMRNRASSNPVPGTLTDPTGQALPITLAVRSTTRRNSDVCDFTPLKVEFTAPPPASSPLAGQKKLKLVTHCGSGGEYQQHELLEYSAYRMLNAITPRSFQVRLASIDYRDPSGKPIISRYGFFIEDLKDLARRNGLKPTHTTNMLPVADLSPEDSARYALFQHMIANHDWSMRAPSAGKECCHNAELIGPVGPGSVVPIPYDFDYSGLVDAPYAVPPAQLKISSVKQRVYRGYCAHNAQAMAVARQLRAERPQIIGVLSQTPDLSPRMQSSAAAFLGRFFDDISTDESTNAKVLGHCVN